MRVTDPLSIPVALEFVGGLGTVESKVVACTRPAIPAEVETMGKEGWRLSGILPGIDPTLARLMPTELARADAHTLVFQRPKIDKPAAKGATVEELEAQLAAARQALQARIDRDNATPQQVATDKTVRAAALAPKLDAGDVSLTNPRGQKRGQELELEPGIGAAPSFHRPDGTPREHRDPVEVFGGNLRAAGVDMPGGRADEIRADLARADRAEIERRQRAAQGDQWSPAMRIVNRSGYPLRYATDGAIGLDLHAAQVTELTPRANAEPVQRIAPGARALIQTGIEIELPDGLGALVQPRSGIALKHGVFVVTGTIDRDYRGEICVLIYNAGPEPFEVRRGDRIAQLVIIQAPRVAVVEVAHERGEGLTDTRRGDKGFGSTGR